MKNAFVCALALLVGATAAGSSAAEPPVPGHLVLAKPGGDAVLIWDATPVIVTIVTQKLHDAEANALLLHDGLREIAHIAHDLSPDAKTVTLRITYQKVGDVNPAYGAQTFAGVERYANLTVAGADVRGDRDHFMELPGASPVPAWATLTIIGTLPPRS